MDVVPVMIHRMSFGDRPRFTLSVGDEITFRLELVPAAEATVPADLQVALDGTVETVAVLQRRDVQTGLAQVRLRVTAGPVVATWTAHARAQEPMPVRGALVGTWFAGGAGPLGPPVSGTVRRIRVLRQRVVAGSGPRRRAQAEGAELRDVLIAPREFDSYDGAQLPTDAWEETGVVIDLALGDATDTDTHADTTTTPAAE